MGEKPMLIEILYGSQGSFTLELGQTQNVEQPDCFELHPLPSSVSF